jgi:uncharacterized OB-fold protein
MYGSIYSFTTTYHHSIPLYSAPFVVAVVDIGGSGGPRIVVRVVDVDPEVVRVGDAVLIETRPLPGGSFNVPVAVLNVSHTALACPKGLGMEGS